MRLGGQLCRRFISASPVNRRYSAEPKLKTSTHACRGDEPSTTDSSEWRKAGSQTQTIIGFVKKHPVLIGVAILAVMVITWILVSNVQYAPKPFEPEEPIFSLDFWFS